MNSKSKKITILLFDVTLGILIELLASNTYRVYNVILVIAFAILLIIRILFDWFHETVEEKFFSLELEKLKNEREGNIEIQKEIKRQMQDALAKGDINRFKQYKKIEKEI